MPDSSDAQLIEVLRRLPSVERALDLTRAHVPDLPQLLHTAWIREILAELRAGLRAELRADASREVLEAEVVERVAARLRERDRMSLRRVINGTGVLLHTNLGRAPLPARAVQLLTEAAAGYCSLELDLHTGRRRSRLAAVRGLLARVTGAETGTVVHNTAAAVFLALTALAHGREVVVSRAHLVEIGGSFRLPDIMAASGARLVEVGTTNRTRLSDYERAITERTAMFLKVHPSNFRMVGFTEEVSTADLSALARERGILCFEDLGSGALEQHGDLCFDEPTVQASCLAGAHLVAFSGDKLLGGPQAGVVVGAAEPIERMVKHPVARVVRLDKTMLAALESTLEAYLDPPTLRARIPLQRMLGRPVGELEDVAASLIEGLSAVLPEAQWSFHPVASDAEVGGGSLPGQGLPSRAVDIRRRHWSPDRLARAWRASEPAVLGRIENDRFLLDVRGFLDGDVSAIIDAATRIERVDAAMREGEVP